MYSWLRKGLFSLPPETAHELAMESMKFGGHFGLPRLMAGEAVEDPLVLMGIEFPNRVGLAAGLDKNGDYIDALGQLGFGHLELGTVTPKPQPGNPQPRMFRVKPADAIINRMGFNNEGVDHLVERLEARRYSGVVGANIGKQKDTPVDRAAADYLICLEKVYPHCDYVAVNISSPNTENLRQLQDSGHLRELLEAIVRAGNDHAETFGGKCPIVVKIAPDWEDAALTGALETIAASGVDGLNATNTTISRDAIAGLPHADEAGGLSGAPLLQPANRVLKKCREVLGDSFPIMGSGGIMSGGDAVAKIAAGADVVQLYTGFIYNGPNLVHDCAHAICKEYAHVE
ncbi:MAG: quinone-dependent dihydroorotate dehydrogenase [Wenzhouxiangellaceae bacterium]|jgi:dihydroorotate dehydrogenase|nr:quinone-dependent dihydroorotate dehydrogenase [Wenzhouxiangellaceae bacterium]MBS3824325.1 quinone-dependent dihydroorotate dehydrogenase [Wenzhouxiangellaceae bacterium]